jgi:hypothetical protein
MMLNPTRRARLAPVLMLALAAPYGCAIGPKYQQAALQSPDDVAIYVYRPAVLANSGMSPEVFLDDERIGTLTNGGYLVKITKPGRHAVRMSIPPNGKIQKMKYLSGGETAFIKLDTYNVTSGNTMTRNYQLLDMPQDVAKQEIAETRSSGS